jgi:hypothetical protein
MDHFTAHRLAVTTEVQTPIILNEHQGSAIRGALYHALRTRFCAFARDPQVECAACALVATCPVAMLVSTFDPNSARGRDVPRPYTIQPPLPGSGHPVGRRDDHLIFRYEPGEPLTFGLTLYAQAMQLFPYVVLAAHHLEEGGIGRRASDAHGQRGTFAIRSIDAENPLSGERRPVVRRGSHQVEVPDIPITHAQVMAQPVPQGAVNLRLLTPTRLVEQGRLVKPQAFCFRPLFQRLLERLESLSAHFSDTPLGVDFAALLAASEQVRVVSNRLAWEDVRSYSTRRRAESPVGGLLGSVSLEAEDWSPFWPWLVWGQFVQVGKDAVKGSGMIAVGG